MKILKKSMRFLGVMMGVIFLVVVILFLLPAYTPKINCSISIHEESIAEIKRVNIGGVEQTLLIRGNNINNPVILFLHGGPGQSEIGYMREYQKQLEKEFVVVRWDQRGAGSSYSKDIPKDSFTLNQFVKDTDDVTDYLRERFNKSKILLCGHSWGTVLGVLAVKDNPEKYLAYIGVGQVVDIASNERISYEFAHNKAIENKDNEAVNVLESIDVDGTFDNMLKYRRYVGQYGGLIKTKPQKGMGSSLLMSSEYNLRDKINYRNSVIQSCRLLNEELYKVNFMEDIKELEIPLYFIAGIDDYTTVFSLVEEFYNQIEAPHKEFIVFENSAHLPQLEEPQKFSDCLIRIKEETLERKVSK